WGGDEAAERRPARLRAVANWAELGDRECSARNSSWQRREGLSRRGSKGGTVMPHFQKGDVRIRYEETGSGFPLLVTPGGGLNSRISNWPTAVINAMEAFRNDFRCITIGPAQRQRRRFN